MDTPVPSSLQAAVEAWAAANHQGAILTGFVLVASVVTAKSGINDTVYLYTATEGLPSHTAVGLAIRQADFLRKKVGEII